MKILLGHCHYRSSAPSGEDAVYRNERKLLEARGHEVIAFERFNDDIDILTPGSRINVARNTAWSQSSYDAVRDLIKKTRPQVAHFHNTFPQMSPSVYAACQEHGVPVVQTLHNYRIVCANGLLLRDGKPCEDCLTGSVISALRHRCYRGSLSATAALVWMQVSNKHKGSYSDNVNRYIVPSAFSIPRLAQGGLPADRIVIKPNFLPNPPVFNQDARAPFAVFVGRLSAEKGVSTLIKAWCQVKNVPLKILGDGELRAELEQAAAEHQLDVAFLGYQPREEVLRIVSQASLQILPSECYEGFPMALLEAYASGTPVVASRLGSLDDLVVEGETGRKFEAGNAGDLANTVTRMLAEDMQRMGAQARALFERDYSSERNYQLLMDIYRDAIADHGQRGAKAEAA